MHETVDVIPNLECTQVCCNTVHMVCVFPWVFVHLEVYYSGGPGLLSMQILEKTKHACTNPLRTCSLRRASTWSRGKAGMVAAVLQIWARKTHKDESCMYIGHMHAKIYIIYDLQAIVFIASNPSEKPISTYTASFLPKPPLRGCPHDHWTCQSMGGIHGHPIQVSEELAVASVAKLFHPSES